MKNGSLASTSSAFFYDIFSTSRRRMVVLLVVSFLINLVLKSAFIQSIPPGATYDEIVYVAEAQSILHYGTDLKGVWTPWRLEPSDPSYSELTSTTLIPGFLLFPSNPVLASKFMPVVLGSLCQFCWV
jgi:hypothetical protein